jgi:hypothetical protein
MTDQHFAYIGRASCGCIRAVIVDSALAQGLQQVARETSRWIRDGLKIERITVEEVRASKLTRPDCTVHTFSRSAERQEALL